MASSALLMVLERGSIGAVFNFGRRLKTLGGLTPCEYITRIWILRARPLHRQSDPPDAGTKHLD